MRKLFWPLLLVAVIAPFVAHAAILPACTESGDCQLTDFLQGFVNLANWGLGIIGLAGVTMFIVGGLYLMLSGGRSTMVSRGKAILAGATTGILIVLFSWVAIGFVYVAVTGNSRGTVFSGLSGVAPFSFFNTAGESNSTTKNATCNPTIDPFLTPGCGDTPPQVGPVQRTSIILNSKPGCSIGAVKTTYDSGMQTVVRAFQAANNLTVDGIIGPATWNALWDPSTHCAPKTVTDPDGNSVATVRTGCCIISNPAIGSCGVGVQDPVSGAAGPYCGPGFTYNSQACDDVANSGNRIQCTSGSNTKWGNCTYLFASSQGPAQRIWPTGTVACNAVGGTIP